MFKEPTFRVVLRLEPILNFNILCAAEPPTAILSYCCRVITADNHSNFLMTVAATVALLRPVPHHKAISCELGINSALILNISIIAY